MLNITGAIIKYALLIACVYFGWQYYQINKTDKSQIVTTAITAPKKPAVVIDRDKVLDLYNQLMKFKDNKDFHESGFSSRGPYGYWMRAARTIPLLDRPGGLLVPPVLMSDDCSPDGHDLVAIAVQYFRSKGKGTPLSRRLTKRFTCK